MTIQFAPTGRRPAATKAREAARFARMVLAASILLVAAFVLGAAVLVPRLAGATPYTVLTGSMSPAYPPGTMIVTRPHGSVGLGSVITFQLVSGKPEVVTHRVVAIARHPDGRMRSRPRATPTTARTRSGCVPSRCGACSGTRCPASAT